MTKSTFIFSDKISHRLTRHLVFWVVYCFTFYLQSLPPRKFEEFFIGRTYYIALMNLCCFAPVFIGAVYFFIYFLLPHTLQKKRYLLFAFLFLLTYAVGTLINFFTATVFLYYTDFFPMTFQHKFEMGNYNTRWAMIIATIALGIKLAKDWYVQQQENLDILKRKIRAEMQLQKARIHPQLLLRSLDIIYHNIQFRSEKATTLILNLSDLLSYSLYESDLKLVPLEKELAGLQNIISLEKQNKESVVEIETKITGNVNGKLIVPMIIVKMFEESITILQYSRPVPHQLVSEIIVSGNKLSLKLTFTSSQENCSPIEKWDSLIADTRNRLSEFYSENDYQVKLSEDRNTIQLILKLADSHTETHIDSKSKLIASGHDSL